MSEALTIIRRTTNKAVKTSITATFSAGTIFVFTHYWLMQFISFSGVPGIPPLLSGSRKRPKCQDKGETSVAFGSCGLPGPPGPGFEKIGILN